MLTASMVSKSNMLKCLHSPSTLHVFHCSSSLPLWGCVGGCASNAPGSRSGRRGGTLHADTQIECVPRLQAHEEGTGVPGDRRWCGDYADTTNQIKIEEGDDCGVRIGRHDDANAHAGDRCTKRARTSAS